MDQLAIDAFDETTRGNLFRALDIDESGLVDLGGFESFVFSRPEHDSILRVTHNSHRDLNAVLGELEWIAHLDAHGAAVSTPGLINGNLAVRWSDFVVCEFSRAPGRQVTEADWGPALFHEWGRCVGEFHRLAGSFEPSHPDFRRMDCRDDPNFHIAARIPDEARVLEVASNSLNELFALPRDDHLFGLIHCDAHPGNYFSDNGRLTFFDFDDSCYCWFGYDVATIFFSVVLQSWMEETDAAREKAAHEFITPFLDGYSREFEVTDFMLKQLPLFLKVRELSLYAVIRAFLEPAQYDDYPRRFMVNRRERIESNVPFLDLSLS